MLTRDEIASVQDFEIERVEVPEWGGYVLIRPMTVGASDELNRFYLKIPDIDKSIKSAREKSGGKSVVDPNDIDVSSETASAMIGHTIKVVSLCLCDESGNLLFNDEEGLEILSRKNNNVIDRICEACMRINKMTSAAVEEEKKELSMTSSIGLDFNSA